MTKNLLPLLIAILFFACKKSNNSNAITTPVNTNFKGKGGIYYLGSANMAVNNSVYANPHLAGVVVRFTWESLETSPDIFNWAFIDSEIGKAKANNKKVSLQLLGYPLWVINGLGAVSYNYIDRNAAHATYLDTLKDVMPWDNIYLNRIGKLINQFAAKYAADTTVAYFNLIAGQVSRGMPDSVITGTGSKAFYTVFNYNADTVVAKMEALLDLYMSKFPNTALWNSVDYVSFESKASGRANNYLCSQYVNYGTATYPDRFGCWREDLAACNPGTAIQTTSQWFTMQQNSSRTGAQMLWSVQDGPDRMNKCGILPNTKQVVLDSAINNGLRLGMRYFEVYGADIQDVSLTSNIAAYTTILKAKYPF